MSEKISSIIDNELKGSELDKGLSELSKNALSMSKFKSYQAIRDVLRKEYLDVNPSLSSKIMDKINDEPTQFNNGFIKENGSVLSVDYKKYLLFFLMGLIVAFLGTWSFNSIDSFSGGDSSAPSFLASDDVTEEILIDHFNTTTRNPNHLLEAGYQPNI